jgi:hypothetical protein
MENGQPPVDGEHRVSFRDGKLSGIEHYSDGQKSGSCEYWYHNGQKTASCAVRSAAGSCGCRHRPHPYSLSPAARASCHCWRWCGRMRHPQAPCRFDSCIRCGVPKTCSTPKSSRNSPLRRSRSTYVYTRETPEGWPVPAGRVSQEILRSATIPAAESPAVFVCGPTGFVESVATWLVELGHDAATVKTERFGGK